MNEKFETIDGETLLDTALKPLDFIIENILPEGLHILAGAPKIGKSWLALWLCIQVSKGEDVWRFKTKKSTTLYLCLEDSIDVYKVGFLTLLMKHQIMFTLQYQVKK